MPRIDRNMQVGEALWILGAREVKDFDAFMRDLFMKAKKWDEVMELFKSLGLGENISIMPALAVSEGSESC